jgi:hypothetical protein
MEFPIIRYSKLKRYHLIDVNEVELNLEDLILDQKTLIPTHLMLGAGFFEELMEELGKKGDIDELAPLNIIKEIDKEYMLIEMPFEELETTNKKGVLPFSAIKFSDLLKYNIKAGASEFYLKLNDIEINGSDSQFIFISPELKEQLLKENYRQRIEIQIKISNTIITHDTIQLPFTKQDIIALIRNSVEPKPRGKSTIKINPQ